MIAGPCGGADGECVHSYLATTDVVDLARPSRVRRWRTRRRPRRCSSARAAKGRPPPRSRRQRRGLQARLRPSIRSLLGRRRVPWPEVAGIRVGRRADLWLVTTGGTELRLPAVRARDLPAIGHASGGRIPVPELPEAQ